jgi:3-deoxy-manno-octulosonate cytidylyltransferase (CMP-KDO synthetase)
MTPAAKPVDYRIVIPARMASTRLPGKPLAQLAGKSLLQHVYLRARQSAASTTVIATDDATIAAHARDFGAAVQMTSASHPSGSDRIAEVVTALAWPDDSIVVNLQGDEPLMPVACLDQVASLLAGDPQAAMASLYWPIDDAADAGNPNIVKVVVSQSGHALYFSRSLLPHPRDYSSVDDALAQGLSFKRHVGLYAYRTRALKLFARLPASPLEQAEKLEQLRMLEHGQRIVMARAKELIPPGVDTLDDLARVEKLILNSVR